MKWNERLPKLEDERRFQHLIDLHQLTQQWLEAVHPSTNSTENGDESFRLQRFVPPQITQNLWMIEKLRLDQLPPDLETLVNATSVSEFLDELEETIWIVQMALLKNILSSSTDTNKPMLMNLLEQTTWHHAKTVAEKRWPDFNRSPTQELKYIYEALKNSYYFSTAHSFLFEQSNSTELSFYWLTSPLSRDSLLIQPEVISLCHLHHHGLRGYVYGLSRNLKTDIFPSMLREQKVWQIQISIF